MIPLSYIALNIFLLINPILCLSNHSSHINPISITMPGKRNFSSYSLTPDQPIMGNNRSIKKLRRLPHVFSKVLELPFNSEADVYVEETHDCLKFVAKTDGEVVVPGVHVVQVHPGITKVLVRRRDIHSQPSADDLELDVWRFRLPATACPELATAVYVCGELVVTVPKNGLAKKNGKGSDCREGLTENMDNLIIVQ